MTDGAHIPAWSLFRRTGGILSFAFWTANALAGGQQYPVKGMVMKVDGPHKTVIVSCDAIPGYMEAMVMPFAVQDAEELEGLEPGVSVSFTLVVNKERSHAEKIQVEHYQGLEVDPLTARRLRLLNQAVEHAATQPLAIGQEVPDFKLLDQNGRGVAISQFAGKIVALNFIYTRCALPDFCFRSSNNFRQLQKRFQKQLGSKLVLLTITFDPAHDRPEVLRKYATIWKADPRSWRFLTGAEEEVQRVSNLFGMDVFLDEGLITHSLHTAIIDRRGRLVANLEGNQFPAQQLGDLVQSALDQRE